MVQLVWSRTFSYFFLLLLHRTTVLGWSYPKKGFCDEYIGSSGVTWTTGSTLNSSQQTFPCALTHQASRIIFLLIIWILHRSCEGYITPNFTVSMKFTSCLLISLIIIQILEIHLDQFFRMSISHGLRSSFWRSAAQPDTVVANYYFSIGFDVCCKDNSF